MGFDDVNHQSLDWMNDLRLGEGEVDYG